MNMEAKRKNICGGLIEWCAMKFWFKNGFKKVRWLKSDFYQIKNDISFSWLSWVQFALFWQTIDLLMNVYVVFRIFANYWKQSIYFLIIYALKWSFEFNSYSAVQDCQYTNHKSDSSRDSHTNAVSWYLLFVLTFWRLAKLSVPFCSHCTIESTPFA